MSTEQIPFSSTSLGSRTAEAKAAKRRAESSGDSAPEGGFLWHCILRCRFLIIPVTTLSYMLRTWPETIARLISGLCVEFLDFSFQLNNHMCAGPPCRFIPLISLRLSAAFCIFPEAANLQERGCMYKAGWLFM